MAGSVQVDMKYPNPWMPRILRVVINWEAAADGSIPEWPIGISGVIHTVFFEPGTPSPTSNYDVTFENELGIDLLKAEGQNIPVSGVVERNIIDPYATFDTVTMKITGNLVAGAKGSIYMYLSEGA